jgi:hypothetical protein
LVVVDGAVRLSRQVEQKPEPVLDVGKLRMFGGLGREGLERLRIGVDEQIDPRSQSWLR